MVSTYKQSKRLRNRPDNSRLNSKRVNVQSKRKSPCSKKNSLMLLQNPHPHKRKTMATLKPSRKLRREWPHFSKT
jgi:hypothetical protein